MNTAAFLQDLQDRLGALLRASPATDLERNLKALLSQTFQRMELVTRDELDALTEALSGLRTRVETLEATIAQMATHAGNSSPADEPPASDALRPDA
jgi:BMFP domain-containing protein YqiC